MLSKPSVLDLNHPPSSFRSRNVTIRREEGDNLARECFQCLLGALRDLVQASCATLAPVGRLKTVALKAAATRLTGGWQTKVEAHNTAKRTEPSWRIRTMRDRAG